MKRILILERSTAVRQIEARMLTAAGYDTEQVSDVEAAMRQLEGQAPAPFAILANASGIGSCMASFASAVKRRSIPIVITAGADSPNLEVARQLGWAILDKPFSSDALLAALDSALGDRAP